MGTQQRSWEHYHQAAEILRSGVLGEISNVEVWDFDNYYPGYGSPPDQAPPDDLDWDFWLGPAPKVAFNPNRLRHHYWFFDYGGGWPVAWAHHHYDIVHWLMAVDKPTSATGFGEKVVYRDSNTQWPDTYEGACIYPPGPVAKQGFLLSYTSRTANQHFRHHSTHGKAFHGAHGSLVLDRTGYELYSEWRDGRKVIVEDRMTSAKSEHEVVKDHINNFIDCVRSRKTPFCDAEVGHLASIPGLLMNISWLTGRRVEWDGQSEQFPGQDDANALITKEYRAPWTLPMA
jgi:predicted dehydrogenase